MISLKYITSDQLSVGLFSPCPNTFLFWPLGSDVTSFTVNKHPSVLFAKTEYVIQIRFMSFGTQCLLFHCKKYLFSIAGFYTDVMRCTHWLYKVTWRTLWRGWVFRSLCDSDFFLRKGWRQQAYGVFYFHDQQSKLQHWIQPGKFLEHLTRAAGSWFLWPLTMLVHISQFPFPV